MTTNEYQNLAMRTQCPQLPVIERLKSYPKLPDGRSMIDVENISLLHGCVGINAEGGELMTAIQRWLWYGKGLDVENVLEELGDLLWYTAEACASLGTTMEAVMEANIRKLQKRYPEKYTDELAAEENRNRAAERAAMENQPRETTAKGWMDKPVKRGGSEELQQTGQGWGEPILDPVMEETPDERQKRFKERSKWVNCTCKVLDFDPSNPTLKLDPRCQMHGVEAKTVPLGPGDGLYVRQVGYSYDRLCLTCKRPVHRSNTLGLCPDCAQVERSARGE